VLVGTGTRTDGACVVATVTERWLVAGGSVSGVITAGRRKARQCSCRGSRWCRRWGGGPASLGLSAAATTWPSCQLCLAAARRPTRPTTRRRRDRVRMGSVPADECQGLSGAGLVGGRLDNSARRPAARVGPVLAARRRVHDLRGTRWGVLQPALVTAAHDTACRPRCAGAAVVGLFDWSDSRLGLAEPTGSTPGGCYSSTDSAGPVALNHCCGTCGCHADQPAARLSSSF